MRKLLVLCFCFCVLFALPAFAQKKTAARTTAQKKIKKPVKIKKPDVAVVDPANVHQISVGKKEVVFCSSSEASCVNDSIIEVETIADDNGNGDTKYLYAVSAGKIIGDGPFVKWDLSGVKPGTYTITAGIDSGWGWKATGSTKTETVKVVE